MKELGQYFPESTNLFYTTRKENHSYYEHCLGENNIIYGNFPHVTFYKRKHSSKPLLPYGINQIFMWNTSTDTYHWN